jgi:putative molybdopterin biosynthesis protein
MTHLYQEIAESVRRRIAAGDLKPGQRLPPVREMAQQWNCTPGTVNRAYRELAEEGLVSGHRGSGTRVLDNTLITSSPDLRWANLVNRAEQYLLEALSSGYTTDQAHSALSVAVSRWQALQKQKPVEFGQPKPERHLRFAGSHDLTVELLAQKLLDAEPNYRLEIDFVGSLGGLIALARGEADVAGVHLWDAATASYNLPFIRRVLPSYRSALVTLVQRKLGFIVPPGNPQHLESLGDLIQPEVHWMNRQAGSGTRLWLDEQLQQAKIGAGQIQGYSREETTHMAVAQAVQSGKATAGLGIQAAAMAYGLNFIPLTEEVYQLVVPEAVWDSPVWQSLLAIIRSDQFIAAVNELGGSNTVRTGEVAWV